MTIIVLDKNFQVSWVWDSFDHLDVNRGPILGEILQPGGADQLTASTPVLPAVDWLHINAVSWSPEDGNLVLSLRNQDWVIKIDYENGYGDGHVIWRLGQGGDFTVNSTDPNPWFSGQHDAHYIDDSTIILFDDGNAHRASDPTADSRGQVWKVDEQTMTATLVVNVDLGNYSGALGSAQRLSNGDYSFDSGFQGTAPHQIGQSIEVRPDGSIAYVLQVKGTEYRSFRMQTLYEGISDQLAGCGGDETTQPGDGYRGLSFGTWRQPDGSPDTEARVKAAEPLELHGISASIPLAGSSPDDFQRAMAAALTASSKPFPLSATQAALAPENVRRLDQLFANRLEDRTSFVLPRSKRNLLSFGDEGREDTVL